MDGTSTLILEGEADKMPSLRVNDSATLNGHLVLRISLPSTFTSYGTWQNYTIMTCRQCQGAFASVKIESSSCVSTEVFQPFQSEKSFHISVLFRHSEVCFAATVMPPLLYCSLLLIGFLMY